MLLLQTWTSSWSNMINNLTATSDLRKTVKMFAEQKSIDEFDFDILFQLTEQLSDRLVQQSNAALLEAKTECPNNTNTSRQ